MVSKGFDLICPMTDASLCLFYVTPAGTVSAYKCDHCTLLRGSCHVLCTGAGWFFQNDCCLCSFRRCLVVWK